jgi:putative SOS response-associated peptidase YedK
MACPWPFAGLWEGWRGPDGALERAFAIVTTYASRAAADLHDRMPDAGIFGVAACKNRCLTR